jgi:sec-independent protein translocase protein TatA
MGAFSLTHWIILLVVVVLVFGTKKLKNLGGDLGHAIKGFKDAMAEPEKDKDPQQLTNEQHEGGTTVDVKAEKVDEKPRI